MMKNLSLSLKKHKDKANSETPPLKERNCSANSDWFSFVASNEILKKASKYVVPVKTEYSFHCAEKNFLSWEIAIRKCQTILCR